MLGRFAWFCSGCALLAAALLIGCSESGESYGRSEASAVEIIEPSAPPEPLPSLDEAARAAHQIIAPPALPADMGYRHDAVTKTAWGSDGRQFWIFEPADPKPESAPVVVFLHGWAEMNPRSYGAWLNHLVRRGHTVIYPRYQSSVVSQPETFTPNMLHAVKRAFDILETGDDRVRPDRDRVAVVGHSMGGLLAANLAALAEEHDLPQFGAVMCLQPGVTRLFNLADLSKIPADTLLLTMAGDVDHITGSADARRIFHEATNVDAARKFFVLVRSDTRGRPALIGDHVMPLGSDEAFNASAIEQADDGVKFTIALTDLRNNGFDVTPWDYHAYWRAFDDLVAAAFGDAERQLTTDTGADFLGVWTDGVPVRQPVIVAATDSDPAEKTAEVTGETAVHER